MARTKKAKHRPALKLYKSYMFTEKDPIIDVVRTIVEDSHRPFARIERDSGVTGQTLRNWFMGPTKRPQFATIAAVARALGHDIQIGGIKLRARKVSLSVNKRTA